MDTSEKKGSYNVAISLMEEMLEEKNTINNLIKLWMEDRRGIGRDIRSRMSIEILTYTMKLHA